MALRPTRLLHRYHATRVSNETCCWNLFSTWEWWDPLFHWYCSYGWGMYCAFPVLFQHYSLHCQQLDGIPPTAHNSQLLRILSVRNSWHFTPFVVNNKNKTKITLLRAIPTWQISGVYWNIISFFSGISSGLFSGISPDILFDVTDRYIQARKITKATNARKRENEATQKQRGGIKDPLKKWKKQKNGKNRKVVPKQS